MPEEEAIQLHEGCRHALLPEEGPGRRRYEPQGHRPRRHRLQEDRRSRRLGQRRGRGQGRACSRASRELVKQVKDILDPVDRMDGDSLPVSAFMPHVDGQFELGAAAYEKRGVAVSVPTWDETKCIQCNNCAYVCPHATIRPFALTEEEAKNAPAAAKIVDIKAGKGKGVYKYTMAISPLDCMGCGVCVGQSARSSALTMVPQEGELEQQEVFDYCVAKVAAQGRYAGYHRQGQPVHAAHARVLRLLRRLRRDELRPPRSPSSSATVCTSPTPPAARPSGAAPALPPRTAPNKDGHGPAWCNSLFEDNAEHGLGMYHRPEDASASDLADKTRELIAVEWARPELKEAAQKWLDTMDDGKANAELPRPMLPRWRRASHRRRAGRRSAVRGARCRAQGQGREVLRLRRLQAGAEILDKKEYLAKKSVWIFGGDGWAYDIGYGGLDHVLASGEDVNIFVFDTEVYSNTGGQASKASNIGQVAQFAAAGKEIKKKSLCRDRHAVRLRLRGAGRHGRQPRPDHQGHHARPRLITARPSSSATPPARCTPSRAA